MKTIVLFVLGIFLSSATFSQSTTKQDLIREYLVLTGQKKAATQMVSTIIESYKKAAHGVTDAFWEQFQKEISTDDLLEMVIPVYDKHFTEDDIREMIAFTKSPIGRKMAEKTPMINVECYQIGAEWGKKIGEKVVARMQAVKEQ